MATLAVKIDPGQAVQGARTIRREIEWVQASAEKMEKSVNRASAATGNIGGGSAISGARVIKRSVDEIAKAADGAGRSVGGFANSANDNFRRLNAQVTGVTGTFRNLMAVMVPLAGLFSIRALQQYADGWSDMQSRVGAAVKNMEAAPALMRRIVDIANASYSPLSQTVEVFGRNVAVLRDLGKTARQAADFTEALNHAMVITATKGQDAEVVQNALSRAIATGGLRAMEYETIMSRSPRVLEAIANEAGTTLTGLRSLATQGKITGQVIADALIKSLAELRAEAAEMPATISDAFVRIGTNLTAFIGQLDKSSGASEAVAAALIKLADNIDRVITYAATATTAFGTYYVAAMGAAYLSTVTLSGALTLLRAALIRTGIGILIVGAGELVYQISKIVQATGTWSEALAELGRHGEILLDAFIWAFRAAGDGIQAIWAGAMADMLRSTEEAFGAILRILGVSTEAMSAAILKMEQRAANMGDAAKSSAIIAAEQFKEAFKDMPALGDGLADEDGKLAASLDAVDEKYKKLITSAQNRIDQMRLELELVGKAGAEAEALRFEQDMLARVMEKFGTITQAQRKEIHALAQEYGALAQAIEEARLRSDLMFEREQIGRTDTEKRVAATMRSLHGDAYKDFMNGADAAAIRFNERLKDTQDELDGVNDAMKDTFVGLIDLLDGSGNELERLIGMFAQLGKMFAKIGMEKLFDAMTGKAPLFGPAPAMSSGSSVAGAIQTGREVGRAIAPVISDNLNSNLQTYAAAIRKIESGSYAGNYGAMGQVIPKSGDRAYGAYQVMGANIKSWTKEVLGTSMSVSQFLGDKMAQDKVFYSKFGQSLDKYGSISDAVSVWFSGRPVGRAGNASDGFNTVPEYIQKVHDAAGGFSKDVADGMMEANRRIAINDNWVTPGGADLRKQSGGGGGFGNMEAMLGVGGAALGAFGAGYESGSPIMGALGGAMSGLGATSALSAMGLGAAAGPIGIIGGAIIGLVGGLLGKSKKKKEELKKAQQELESQLGAITELMATATGNFLGSFQKQFTSTTDELNKAIALAEKAKNNQLAANLQDAMDTFFVKLSDKWERGFEGMVASLEAGQGLEGAFTKGMGAVENMRESLIGFVNDTKFFAEANGDLAKALAMQNDTLGVNDNKKPLNKFMSTYRPNKDDVIENELIEGYMTLANEVMARGVEAFSKTGGQAYATLDQLRLAAEAAGVKFDEAGKILDAVAQDPIDVAQKVREAQEGAQATVLAQLSGAKAFTEMEEAVQGLNGKAAGAQNILEELGMEAELAGKAIEHHLTRGLNNLVISLTTDLTRSINQLAGADYLNDFMDAQTTFETRLRELKAVGMDSTPAFQELALRLRNITKEAELTDDQLTSLAKAFPQLEINLLMLRGLTDSLSVEDAKAAVDDAKADVRSAYEKEKSALEQLISAHKSYIKNIQQMRDDMRINASSPLSAFDKVMEAQKQFRETSALAATGDEEAMGRLTDVSQNYLDEARAYYVSSESYFKIWEEVDKTLAGSQSTAERQLSESQKQLAALDTQIGALIDINDSVLSVADAVAKLAGAQSASKAAEAAAKVERDRLYKDTLALLQANGQAYDPAITQIYKDVLGRTPDKAGGDFWTNAMNTGTSIADIRRLIMESSEAAGIKGFASGGDHLGGLRLVGERGIELEATGPSRIWNATDTQRMLRQSFAPQQSFAPPSNDNSWLAVVAELKALRAEVAESRAAQGKGTAQLAGGLNTQIALLEENNATQAENASTLRKVASGM